MKKSLFASIIALSAFMIPQIGEACSRVCYHGTDSLYVVGRCLDWRTPIPTNLYVYPAGISKVGSDKPGAVSWTSKYGAVYAVSYDSGITEGLNEKGLCINGLFCKGTVYDNEETAKRPAMSLAMFVGWLLDMNATTDEVAAVLKEHNFSLGGATFDEGTVSALHWGVTDASGKSIIFEFDHGDINIYDMNDYYAMTNDPNWPQMTAILDYWNNVGGTNMLPGTVKSPDRCVRANYFAHHVDAVGDSDLGTTICRTVLINSCVPYTYQLGPNEPNVSSTQWRSYSNVRDRIYGFEPVTNYGYFYIDLKKCDLRPGASILKLDTSKTKEVVGEANRHLQKDKGFTPAY